MAILTNIRSVFSRKKREEASAKPGLEEVAVGNASGDSTERTGSVDGEGGKLTDGEERTSVDAESSAMAEVGPPLSNVVNIYSHGFTNGVFRLEPDAAGFERFLEFCNQSDKIKAQQVLNKKAIARTEERLNAGRAAYAADRDIVVEKGKVAGSLASSMDELAGLKVVQEQKEALLVEQQKETVAEYSWVPALLFLSAGITFITADVAITKQITSWGFNMSGAQGWIYAVGLAFTAFLIKPGIDRMLEKPFQASGFRLKTIYKCFLIGITVIGLLMLWFLGRFRADSERARTKLEEINNEMSILDPRSPAVRTLEEKANEIQSSLDENNMGQNGLVMSGLLFAVGGAICLSISFGSLKQLINRYWILPVRIGRVRRKTREASKRIDGVRAEYTLVTTDQEKAEKRLSASEVAAHGTELNKLYAEELALLAAFYEAQSERERALYRDGQSRGEKFRLDGELLYRVPGNEGAKLYVGKENGANGVSSLPRPYTRRPFVKMRKMIADNFNKNQNNPTYDGTEFEIVS